MFLWGGAPKIADSYVRIRTLAGLGTFSTTVTQDNVVREPHCITPVPSGRAVRKPSPPAR